MLVYISESLDLGMVARRPRIDQTPVSDCWRWGLGLHLALFYLVGSPTWHQEKAQKSPQTRHTEPLSEVPAPSWSMKLSETKASCHPLTVPIQLGHQLITTILDTGRLVSMIQPHLVPMKQLILQYTVAAGMNYNVFLWPCVPLFYNHRKQELDMFAC